MFYTRFTIMHNVRAKIRLFIIIFIPVLLLILFAWLLSGPPQTSWQTRMLLGDRTLAVIRNTTQVETFLILPHLHQQSTKTTLDDPRKIADYIIISKGKDLSGRSIEQLSSALLTAISSDSKRAHTGFEPGIALRLWSKDKAVDIAICFKCGNMSVEEFIQEGTPPRSFSYLRSIESVRPILVKLVKEAFPNDNEIRKIDESIR